MYDSVNDESSFQRALLYFSYYLRGNDVPPYITLDSMFLILDTYYVMHFHILDPSPLSFLWHREHQTASSVRSCETQSQNLASSFRRPVDCFAAEYQCAQPMQSVASNSPPYHSSSSSSSPSARDGVIHFSQRLMITLYIKVLHPLPLSLPFLPLSLPFPPFLPPLSPSLSPSPSPPLSFSLFNISLSLLLVPTG